MALFNSTQTTRFTTLGVVALLLFALTAVASLLTNGFSSSLSQPPLSLLISFGLIAILAMSLVVYFLMKVGMGFSRAATFFVISFNALIIIVKYILSPYGLYLDNAKNPFYAGAGILSGINNSQSGFVLAAIASTVAYMLTLWVIFILAGNYRIPKITHDVKKPKKIRPTLIIALLAIVAIWIGWQVIMVPLFVAGVVLGTFNDYIAKLAPVLALILSVLALGIILAVASAKRVGTEAKQLQKPAMISSVLWLCLCLILMYHILWVIFMTALVTIWPFKTFIPNTK